MNKKRIVLAILGILIPIAVIFSLKMCSKDNVSAAVKDPVIPPVQLASFIQPIKSIDVPFLNFNITTGIDTVITLASGTQISIPACAFEANKNVRNGDVVQVKFREIDSKDEIMASGIPMNTGNQTSEFLETTGMMELRANKNSHSLIANPKCNIKIELANTEAGNNVNLYFLDEQKRNWQELQKSIPAKIYTATRREKIHFNESKYLDEASRKGYFKPAKPIQTSKGAYNFHFKINLQQLPELNIYDGIVWEYAGTGGKDDPRKHPWVEHAVWKEMLLAKTKKEGVFTLTLISKEKTFSTVVRPRFEKEDMEYAMDIFNDRYAKYRSYVDKKRKEEERSARVYEQVSRITRSFEIANFGIYNCDKYYNETNPLIVQLSFSTPAEIQVVNLYVMEKEINSVMRINVINNAFNNLRLKRTGNYSLMFLDSEGELHSVSSKEFSTLLKKSTTISIPLGDKGILVHNIEQLQKELKTNT